VMRKVVDRAFESPEYVEIGRFSGQGHRRSGECGLAVESGAAQNSAGEEMGNRLQAFFVAQNKPWLVVKGSSFALPARFYCSKVGWPFGTSTVSASCTMDNVMGSRPSSSPSAST